MTISGAPDETHFFVPYFLRCWRDLGSDTVEYGSFVAWHRCEAISILHELSSHGYVVIRSACARCSRLIKRAHAESSINVSSVSKSSGSKADSSQRDSSDRDQYSRVSKLSGSSFSVVQKRCTLHISTWIDRQQACSRNRPGWNLEYTICCWPALALVAFSGC